MVEGFEGVVVFVTLSFLPVCRSRKILLLWRRYLRADCMAGRFKFSDFSMLKLILRLQDDSLDEEVLRPA